jgi:hypothetical protein
MFATKNRLNLRKKNLGLSPVISTVILSTAVLIVGIGVWYFVDSASNVITADYVEDTVELLREVTERFEVEHANSNDNRTILDICIYNYGDVTVELDIYANVDNETYSTDNSIIILPDDYGFAEIDFNATKGQVVSVQAYSRRQNVAFYKYIVG